MRWYARARLVGLASLVAAVTLVGAVLVPVPPARAEEPATVADTMSAIAFADVDPASSFAREIAWLANAGISTGWGAGSAREYRPFASITRDAMAAFLYRFAGEPEFDAPEISPFVDVEPGQPFYTEITWLAAENISTGWSTSRGAEFRPYDPIARDAMAAFLYRFAEEAGFAPPAVSPFTDVDPSRQFYTEITWLADAEISTGWATSTGAEYRPLDAISRDAMAAFLYRFQARVVPTVPVVDEVIVAPETTIIDAGDTEGLEVAAGAVVLPADSPIEARPNDVIVAGVTPETPAGLLVRVESVDRMSDGTSRIHTRQATVAEAIVSTDGPISMTGVFEDEPGIGTVVVPAPSLSALAGGPVAPSVVAGVASPVLSVTVGVEQELTVDGEIKQTGNPSATLSGKGTVGIEAEGTVALSARATIDIAPGLSPVRRLDVALRPEVGVSTTVSASGEVSGELKYVFATLSPKITFAIGPVPVVVTATTKLSATAGFTGEASAEVTTAYTTYADYGFTYRNGAFALLDGAPVASGPDVAVEASASLGVRASIDLDADVKLYGIVGFTMGFGPFATAEISVTGDGEDTSWSCPAELGLEGRVGLVAGIEIWGMKLGGEWRPDPISVSIPIGTSVDYCADHPFTPPDDLEPALVIVGARLPLATTGSAYDAQLAATGGTAPYAFTIVGLPAGLAADSSGAITGTPSETGVFDVTIGVRDAVGATTSIVADLAVQAPATAGVPRLVSATVDGTGTLDTFDLAVSEDGRYVAMSDTVAFADDPDGHARDVVVKDRWTGEIALASPRSAAATEATPEYEVRLEGMSADARFVAMRSGAEDLVPDVPDWQYNFEGLLYVRDLAAGVTRRIDAPSEDYPDGCAPWSEAFTGDSSELIWIGLCVGEDRMPIFATDTATWETTLLYVPDYDNYVELDSVSADGRVVSVSHLTFGNPSPAKVYVLERESGEYLDVTGLTAEDHEWNGTTWSSVTPDGSAVFYGQCGGGGDGVEVFDLATRSVQNYTWYLGGDGCASNLKPQKLWFSPDGEKAVAMAGSDYMVVVDIASGDQNVLYRADGELLRSDRYVPWVRLAQSEAGYEVIFSTETSYSAIDDDATWDIYAIPLDEAIQ